MLPPMQEASATRLRSQECKYLATLLPYCARILLIFPKISKQLNHFPMLMCTCNLALQYQGLVALRVANKFCCVSISWQLPHQDLHQYPLVIRVEELRTIRQRETSRVELHCSQATHPLPTIYHLQQDLAEITTTLLCDCSL